MDKLDIQEKIWGGIFGVIAIIAAIVEMFANGADFASICGMIKDVFGTLVVVIVMVAVAKLISPKKQLVTFEDKLTDALNQWIDDHSNMIVKTAKMPQGHENDFGMSMTTDINRFYNTEKLKSSSGSGVGRFFRITQIDKNLYIDNNVQLEFFINAQTYCSADTSSEDAIKELLQIGKNLASYIVGAVEGVEHGEPRKLDSRTVIIPISFKDAIVSESEDRIDLLINLIDRMYEAMLVSARRK